MREKERVYLYTRVSTAIQTDGYSLEAQRQKILDFAKFRDFAVVGEYSDAGFSGKNIAGRKEFQQMLSDIESRKDKIRYVLVLNCLVLVETVLIHSILCNLCRITVLT